MRALPARYRRHGLSVFLGLLVVTGLSAAPPAAATDPALEQRTRSALAADRELAGLALTVSVVDRIAVVGGPVPDAATANRVETSVRAVPGLADVRVECWVPGGGEDPLRRLVADRLRGSDRPPLVLAPGPTPEPPPVLALALAPPAREQPRPRDTVTVQRIAAPALADLLQAPVPRGGGPPPAGASATIPPTAVPVAPVAGAGSVPAVLAALRRDPRFAGLTVEWRSGAAVIGGRAARDADPWAFAEALRKLPGVGLVVVGTVDVP